ncbi:hypothetical protein [Burkholderia cenocepacia]|uniref:hypothetical protein n=1 Tax=Burkholderia cenocepacia TaxID=95486 RepID=UPI002ABE64AB|nr:hypothetical protein [Burkholderia cenocepacia]
MTTDKSRADALTEAERLLLARVNDCTKPIDAADRNGILKLIDRLAACPVEQPAAAPIDKRCVGWAILNGVCVVDFSRDRAEADRTACEMQRSHDLSGSLASFHVEPVFIRTDAAPVPAPADERAAFESLKGAWQSMPPFDVFCAGWQAGRASSASETGAPIGWAWISPTGHVSRFTADFDGKHDQLVQGWKVRPVAFCDSVANETGAEGELIERLKLLLSGDAAFCRTSVARSAIERAIAILSRAPAQAAEPVAQWQYRIRTPGYDGDWHNCNPETAKRLQEQPYAEDHDVRALYAAPQPPAPANAREGLTDEQRTMVRTALAAAKQFIANGVELGFIRMPDTDCPDPARSTPKLIDGALALLAAHPSQPEPRAEVTDSARLDWIAHHGISLRQDPDTKRWFLVAPYHTKIECVDDHTRFESARAAIDAARAGDAS